MTKARFSRYYAIHFLRVDFFVAVSIAAISTAVIGWAYGLPEWAASVGGIKGNLYSALFSLGGCLLGFLVSAAAVVIAFSELPRFKVLKDSGQAKNVTVVFFGAMRWLSVLMAFAFVALLFDTKDTPITYMVYLLWFVSLVSAFRVYRCAWLLKRLTLIAVSPASRPVRNGLAA